MRLYELINPVPVDTNRSRREHNYRINQRTTGDLGAGSFATVSHTDSPSKLNQVKKLGRAETFTAKYSKDDRREWEYAKSVDEDGYLSFIQAVIDTKPRNPYFPRVINLKVKRDPKGEEIYYDIDLERLHSFRSLDEDVRTSLSEYMFTEEACEKYNGDIVGMISMVLERNRASIVKDPELNDALAIIKSIADSSSDFIFDIKADNMMWRMTGNRPQLVITDPLA